MKPSPSSSCLAVAAMLAVAPGAVVAAPPSADRPELKEGLDNKPERLEWFRDLGFGMFIHWGVDSALGGDISHSLAGASDAYRKRYFAELPGTFRPRRFHPEDWARLARLAGMKYVVFTTKHHSGFAMWNTRTTPFAIGATPHRRDVVADVVKAFRAEGLAVGFYFSPEDFHWLHQNGKPVTRRPHPGVTPQENPDLMKLARAQLRELGTRYGAIDVWFLDGPAAGMRDVIWRAQPRAVITRDVIETPEQSIPGVPLDRPWESCLTMGTQWSYKPTHETYRSGSELIQILIETRAKGGNLLLNVGPKPDGELPIEQEERLREIALWSFSYDQAIHQVRPWVVTNEGNIWFTRKKDEDTVYLFLTKTAWNMGERKTFTVRSVRPSKDSQLSVLGASGDILEYKPDADARSWMRQDAQGLHLDVMMAQRHYNDRKWPNPLVLKITKVSPALRPPVVVTSRGERAPSGEATFHGNLQGLGEAPAVEVAFQYRPRKAVEELLHADAPWQQTPYVRVAATGPVTARAKDLKAGRAYEFRAVVKHPLLTVYGEEKAVTEAKPGEK
jgi:alpha-L-fucosidase